MHSLLRSRTLRISSLLNSSFSRNFTTHPDFSPRLKAPVSTAVDLQLKATIEALIKAHPVVLFMKGNAAQPMCGFSAKSVQLLQKNSAAFHTEDILKDPKLRQFMKDFSQWPTFPQLYVKGEFVGGCDIMTQMDGAGDLKELLKDVPKLA